MSRFLPPPIRILKVYKQALMGFCHIHSPEGLNGTLLSQGCILETSPCVGVVGGTYVPRTGEGGEESLIAWVQLQGQPATHPLNDLLQQPGTYFISLS